MALLLMGELHATEFIKNEGQFHNNVSYRYRTAGAEVFFEKQALMYHFYENPFAKHDHGEENHDEDWTVKHHAVQVKFMNSQSPAIAPSKKQEHYYNYFIGDESSKWQSGVPAYRQLSYQGIYDEIDLAFYFSANRLKYDIILHPGANPNEIALAYEGFDKLKLKDGALEVKTSLGVVVEDKPYAYQVINKETLEVKCSYKLINNILSFELSKYNEAYDLIIDPTLIFSTFSGSSSDNFGNTATFDSQGYLYSGSSIFGTVGTYPTSTGAYSSTFAGGDANGGSGGNDIGITKWDTTGSSFIWSTYLGGNADELPHSLVVNSRDELYLLGTTGSNNFPTTTGAYDRSFAGGSAFNGRSMGIFHSNGVDIVVAKLSSTGQSLIGSSYLGGSGNDGLNESTALKYNYADEVRGEIDIDANDQVLIASSTSSTNFPMVGNGFQSTPQGNQDGIIVKMNSSLSAVIWSSYFGGAFDDAIYSLSFNTTNDVLITGGMVSTNLSTHASALYRTNQGGRSDGFVAEISSSGQTLVRATYFGTGSYDQAYFIETDADNNVYLFGQTEDNWSALIRNAQYGRSGSGQFVSKLGAQLDTIIWSTRFGTSTPISQAAAPNISPTAFLVDLCNSIYLSGWGGNTNTLTNPNTTDVTGMQVTNDAYQSTTDGSDFYLAVLADDASSLKYGSFFGGTAGEHVDGGTSRFSRKGKIYQAVCAGCGGSNSFPTTTNAYSRVNASANCNLGVFKMDFNLPIVVSDFTLPLVICIGDSANIINTSLKQGSTNFVWDFGDGTTSSSENPGGHRFTQAGKFDVKLVVTDTGTCNLGDSLVKEITVISDTSFRFPDINMCYGDSQTLGGPVQPIYRSFEWMPVQGLSNPNTLNPRANPNDTTTYTLLLENNICIDTAFQTVFVDSSVVSIVLLDPRVCLRDSLPIINASKDWQATQYFWDFGNGDTSTLKDPNYRYTLPGNYTLTLAVTDTQSCNLGDTSSVPIVIIDDTIYSLPPIIFCPGDTFQIGTTPTIGRPYQWEPPGNLSNPRVSNPLAFPDSTTQFVLLADNSACYDSIFQLVQEDSVIEALFTAPQVVCAPFTATFTNQSRLLQNSNFFWDFGNGDTSLSNNPTRNYPNPGSFNIKLIVSDTAACNENDTLETSILVDQDSSFVLDTLLNCNNQGIEIGVSPNSNYSYTWDKDDGLNDSSIANPVSSTQSFEQYRLFIDRGACVDTAFQAVDVDSVVLMSDNDTSVCTSLTGILVSVDAFGTGFRYHFASHPSFIDTINVLKTDSFAVLYPNQAFQDYYVRVFSEKGCLLEDTFQLTTGDLGVETSADDYICIYDTISLEAFTTIPGDTLSYDWNPSGEIIGPTDESIALVTPIQTTPYIVRTENLIGCIRFDTIVVSLSNLDSSQVRAFTSRDTILENEVAQLRAQPGSGYIYLWSPAAGLDDPESPEPIANPDQSTTYEVKVFDPVNGDCVYGDSVQVNVRELLCDFPEIYVPNAFTPQGDQTNEVLYAYGRWIDTMYFAIYDRWGEKVFETEDKSIGWDGTFRGEILAPDVYVYYIEGTCLDQQAFELKGNITLIR